MTDLTQIVRDAVARTADENLRSTETSDAQRAQDAKVIAQAVTEAMIPVVQTMVDNALEDMGVGDEEEFEIGDVKKIRGLNEIAEFGFRQGYRRARLRMGMPFK